MEVLQRLCGTIDYMEDHLQENIQTSDLAKIACCSKFHYQRLFQMLTGITVATYIRNRRLTLAAQELRLSNEKVIEIALKYGYETPESFSRAFRTLHGVSPTQAKLEGIKLKAFPKLSFQIQIKGAGDMNYKIMSKAGFHIVGKELHVTTENGENLKKIPKFWDECHENGSVRKLASIAGDLGILGVCTDFDEHLKNMTYMIAVEKTTDNIPEGTVVKEVPSLTWAVFEAVGPLPKAIQETWNRIFSEWFPATGYEHAYGPELEVYPSDGDVNSEEYKCEIWIPIMEKK